MDRVYDNYAISGHLAGEWMDDQLYLVNVESATFVVLSQDASYLIHQMVEQGSLSAAVSAYDNFLDQSISPNLIEQLVEAGILVEEQQSQLPMISARPDYDVRPAVQESAVVESGKIEKRMVASSTTLGASTTVI